MSVLLRLQRALRAVFGRRALLALIAALPLAGCERLMHNMYDQPRLDPGEASPLFPDGLASRLPPPGSVPRAMGDTAATTSGRDGQAEVALRLAALRATALPSPLPRAMLVRGQQRYTIYCMPCHSPVGDGDGPIVRRGFPHPPSFHSARLRDADDRHFFDVISQGFGAMYSYADRVTPEDRWAIVAYIRALQLSQHAPVDALPAGLRAQLDAGSTGTANASGTGSSTPLPPAPAASAPHGTGGRKANS
jgi:mono/diheme cytochrome c family protein